MALFETAYDDKNRSPVDLPAVSIKPENVLWVAFNIVSQKTEIGMKRGTTCKFTNGIWGVDMVAPMVIPVKADPETVQERLGLKR